MGRLHIFSDEAGDFSFARDGRASRYFMVCTVSMDDCGIGNDLIALRRDMVWRKLPVREEFHASEDKDAVRHEVFDIIAGGKMRIDATLLDKPKSRPDIYASNERFYQFAWFYHINYLGPILSRNKEELSITAAALGTKKGQAVFTTAVNNALQQTVRHKPWMTFFPRAVADPCLQVADYCAWAIQRKWERGDDRWFNRISHNLYTQFDLWRSGTKEYY